VSGNLAVAVFLFFILQAAVSIYIIHGCLVIVPHWLAGKDMMSVTKITCVRDLPQTNLEFCCSQHRMGCVEHSSHVL